MKAAHRQKIAASMRRRWARIPREPKRAVRVFAEDAQLLQELVSWPSVGRSAALTLRALLQATKGSLWTLDRNGKPVLTVGMFAGLLVSPR